jgi:tetratricopeptide (TPR) repeat protein
MVFVKDTPENKNIIKKYRIDLEKQLYPVPTEPKIEEAAEKKAEPVYYVVGADILLHMGFPEKALSLLEIAEKFRCPGYMLYIFKGACYFDMNEYSKALEEFLKALPYSGYNSAELYTNIGSCYGKLGNLEKALKYFNFALQVNPGDERAKKYIKMTQETLNKTMRSNGAL